MEKQNLYDWDELESEDLSIGLLRLSKEIPDYEFFFHVNNLNTEHLQFSRVEDLVLQGKYFDHSFPRFQGYHNTTKTCITVISNKSSESLQKSEITELFVTEEHIKYLLNHLHDVDYVIHTSDEVPDFSVILLPKDLAFPLQEDLLSSEDELYQIIQYYE